MTQEDGKNLPHAERRGRAAPEVGQIPQRDRRQRDRHRPVAADPDQDLHGAERNARSEHQVRELTDDLVDGTKQLSQPDLDAHAQWLRRDLRALCERERGIERPRGRKGHQGPLQSLVDVDLRRGVQRILAQRRIRGTEPREHDRDDQQRRHHKASQTLHSQFSLLRAIASCSASTAASAARLLASRNASGRRAALSTTAHAEFPARVADPLRAPVTNALTTACPIRPPATRGRTRATSRTRRWARARATSCSSPTGPATSTRCGTSRRSPTTSTGSAASVV